MYVVEGIISKKYRSDQKKPMESYPNTIPECLLYIIFYSPNLRDRRLSRTEYQVLSIRLHVIFIKKNIY